MNAGDIASNLPARRTAWRRFFSLPGVVTVASFLGNELLMAAVPWSPFFWAIPYFPLKAVGIPVCALFETASLIGSALIERSRTASLRTLTGMVLIILTLWLNFHYDPGAFLDFVDQTTGRRRDLAG